MKDKLLEKLIKSEVRRQQETIDLIPSENFPSPDILRIVGSPLLIKYSEGYPGKRYYPGNIFYDQIETLAQERALKVFGLNPEEWAVNVQPYSGSPANMEVYSAVLAIGDTIMGMQLPAGGHLTHGHKVNFSGKAWRSVQYGVDQKTHLIDYGEIERLAKEAAPKMIVSGLTHYPRTIDFKKFGAIALRARAYHLADISHIAGLVAAGVHPSPFPYADVVTMTTHKTLRGPRGAMIFSRRRKVVNPVNGEEALLPDLIDRAVFPGMQGGPHNNTTGAIAQMCFEALQPSFKKYQQQIVKNAAALASALQKEGFTLITGGTDNHLMLIDVRPTGLDGKTAEARLEKNGIIANRNSLPSDDKPFRPNGIRLGTPAVTTRNYKEKDMVQIAKFFRLVLIENKNVKSAVVAFCKKHPLPYKF